MAAIVTPPLAAWAVGKMICELVYWIRFSRTFRDTHLKPIALEHMLPEAQAIIRQHSERIDELGFVMLGNFQVKPEPMVNEYRFYLSADGCVLLGIGRVDTSISCCVMSYFAEGPIVETSLTPLPSVSESFIDKLKRHGEIIVQQFDFSMKLEAAIERHQSLVAEVRSARGIEVYPLKPSDLSMALYYENRKFGSFQSKMRKLNSVVEEPKWPFKLQ